MIWMNVPQDHAVTPVLTLLVHSIVSVRLLDLTLQVIGAPVPDLTVEVQMHYLVYVHQTLTVTTSLQSVLK